MDNPQKKPKTQPPYHMKGIPINAYLSENGEFKWIPHPKACTNKENTKNIIEVFRKMPIDRRNVWASRLDKEQTFTTCPIIQNEPDLHKEFDEIAPALNKPKPEKTEKGGEAQDE
jgi:hypothetical protein